MSEPTPTSATQPAAGGGAQTPVPDPNSVQYSTGTRVLYAAVIIMGVMIVAGVGLVIGRIIYLASKSEPSDTPATISQPNAEHRLALPAGAIIEQTSVSGNRLIVRYKLGKQITLIIYDLAKSRVVSKVALSIP